MGWPFADRGPCSDLAMLQTLVDLSEIHFQYKKYDTGRKMDIISSKSSVLDFMAGQTNTHPTGNPLFYGMNF